MKRLLSITASLALGLTLSPVGATATPSASPAAGSLAPAGDSSPLERVTFDVDSKKKKCTYMCVQSTLPGIQKDAYFVDGNRHLISVNSNGYTRRDLDTRKVTGTTPYEGEMLTTKSAVAPDGLSLLIAGTSDSGPGAGNLRFISVDTETFEQNELDSEDSPTVPLTSQNLLSMAVSPDNSGWFMVLRDFNEYVPYLCRFNGAGQEVGCSESFVAGSTVSPIFFDSTGENAYLVSERTLYTFDLSDLSFTSTSLGDIEINLNGVMAPDDNMYFYSNVQLSDSGDTAIYKVTTRGIVTVVAQISGVVMFSDIVAPMNEYGVLYLMGRPKNSGGSWQNYSLVFGLDYANETFLLKAVKIKSKRGLLPESLAVDSYGRYVLVFAGTNQTSVIPVERYGSSRVITSATYVTNPPAGWQIDWDFINLAPGAKLKKYQVWYKAPNTSKWRKMSKINTGREHTTLFTAGVSGGLVKVLPIGVRVSGYNWAELTGECTIPRVGAPQPIC
jgi:hypothetical protein